MTDILVTMAGNASGLVSAAASGQQAMQGLADRARGMGDTLKAALTSPIGIASALAAGLGALATAGFRYASALDEIADQTGVTAASIIALERAAISAGIGSEALTGALRTMNNVVGQAILGSEGAEKTLAKLGLRLSDLKGLTVEERFLKIGEAIGTIEDTAERAALAQELLGKSGTKLAELLPNLRAKFDEANQAMFLTSDAANEATAEIDKLGSKLGTALQGAKEFGLYLAGNLAGNINLVTEKFKELNDNAPTIVGKSGFTVGAVGPRPTSTQPSTGPITPAEIAAARARRDAQQPTVVPGADRKATEQQILAEIAARKTPQAGPLPVTTAPASLSAEDQTKRDQIAGYQAQIAESVRATAKDFQGASAAVVEFKTSLDKQFADARQQQFGNDGQNFDFVTGRTPAQQAARDARQAQATGLVGQIQGESQDIAADKADPLEIERQQHEQRLALLTEAKQQELLAEGTANAAIEAEQANHAERVKQIEEAKRAAILNIASSTFGNLATLMQSKNKQLFQIGKVAAIAQATINAYQAASNAMATVPYPFNFAAAASSLVAGMVQVQNIASVQPGGGGGGGGGAGGGAAYGSAGNVGVGASSPNGGGSPTNISVSLDDDGIVSGRAVRRLIDGINAAHKDGYVLRVN